MLFNSSLFSKIESAIGVDKWVKVLDITDKSFMKSSYTFLFHIWNKKQTEYLDGS